MTKEVRLTDWIVGLLRSSDSDDLVALKMDVNVRLVRKERKLMGINIVVPNVEKPIQQKVVVPKIEKPIQQKVVVPKIEKPICVPKIQRLNVTQEVTDLLCSQKTTAEIARITGFSESCIRRHRQKINVHPPTLLKMSKDKIALLRNSTLNSKQIALVLGVSVRTVNTYRLRFKNDTKESS